MSKYSSRRTFLKLSAAGLAAAALSRGAGEVRAAGTVRARRVLILNLAGGIRSSAGFVATDKPSLNPYGLLPGVSAPFALGRLLGDTPPGSDELPVSEYDLGPAWNHARVPRLREVASQFSVLGTFSLARGDHNRARLEEPSGDANGAAPGLLTRIVAGLAKKAGGDLPIPAFHIMPYGRFGGGDGSFSRHVPVSLASWRALPSSAADDPIADALSGNGFMRPDLIDAFDDRRLSRRAAIGRQTVNTYSLHRRSARAIGKRLSQPDFAITDEIHADSYRDTVDINGTPKSLTNKMLLELFTRCLGPGDPTSSPYYDHAIDLAVTVRLLQLGAPACCTELPNFDFHSGERTGAPPLYSFLGRAWATLRWLLPKIPDPSGSGSLFDHTLVMTTSDFGRDDMGSTGWNSAEGSDHGATYGTSYLGHAWMGAGTRQGQLFGAVNTSTYDARNEPVQYSVQQVLATTLDALGLDSTDPDYGLPAAGRTITELWT